MRLIDKNKKKIRLLLVIFVIFFLFYLILHKKSYEIKYSKSNFEITEKYDKKNKLYSFKFKGENKEFFVKIENKYIRKKKLINEIQIKKDDNTLCIIPKSKKLNMYPLCYQNDQLISYHQIKNKELISDSYFKKIKNKKSTFKKIKINNLNDNKYYIWNYKGFYVIDGENNTEINLFDKDIYNIPLATSTNKYLFIPDYNSNYNFNKGYIINSKNNKIKELETKEDISFESYILGNIKNKIYLMDKKNKKEYEINSKRIAINEISKKNKGKIYEKDEWKEISINKLSSKETNFSIYKPYDYQIIDKKLYLCEENFKTLISDLEVKEIIKIDKDTVYYLVDNKLYYYNPQDGEVLVMTYFEWNFNYKNMIFIF